MLYVMYYQTDNIAYWVTMIILSDNTTDKNSK
jgi:hypothetical protein